MAKSNPGTTNGPIRGRDRELARLNASLDRATRGLGSVAFLEGEAGIGKSRLLDAVGDAASGRDAVVWRAKAEEMERGRPFSALLRAIGTNPRGVAEIEEIGQLLNASAVSPATGGWVEVPELRFRVIDSLLELVDRVASESAIVLTIDDLHWADESTVEAVIAFARACRDRPLLIALAARPLPRPEGFRRLATQIEAENTMKLRALDDEAVRSLLTDLIGKEAISPPLLDVMRQAGGNPFFVIALARTLLGRDGEIDPGEPLPLELRQSALLQFADMDRNVQEVLATASMLGGSIAVEVLAAVRADTVGGLVPTLATAIDAGILEDDGSRIAFRHDLVREAVYQSITPTLRSALHLEIGHLLLSRGLPAADCASHFLLGARHGDIAASQVLRRAAAELGRVAPSTATDLLERALELLPRHHPDHQSCRVELVQSYVFSGDLERGSDLAALYLTEALPRDLEITLRNTRAQVMFLQGQPRQAAEEFMAIAPLLAGSPRQAVVLGDAAVSAMFAVEMETARELAHRSIESARAQPGSVAPTLAFGVLSWIRALEGDLDGAMDAADEAVASADAETGLDGHRRIPHLFRSQVLVWAGRDGDAAVSIQRGIDVSAELGMGWDEPMYQALLADMRIRCGDWDDALAEAEGGLERGREVGSLFAHAYLHIHRAKVLIFRGSSQEGRAALDEAERALANAGGQGADQMWWLRGLLELGAGHNEAASTILGILWDRLGQAGLHLRRAEYAVDVIRAARASGDERLMQRVLSELGTAADATGNAQMRLAHAWASALAGRDSRLALDAAHQITHRPDIVDRARCLADVAAILREAQHDRADDLEREARAILHQLGATWLEVLHLGAPPDDAEGAERARSGWGSLTRSERRVVELVGDGLSNAQIAERLSISRRTVESHLYHVYPKLGLSSRLEVAVSIAQQHHPPAASTKTDSSGDQ